MSDWDVEIGETLPRRELHARHGGAWYGGMEPAVASNSVFLFTNPTKVKFSVTSTTVGSRTAPSITPATDR